MANKNLVQFLERVNRGFLSFCVHVYDFAGVSGKHLEGAKKGDRLTLGMFVKDSLSDVGIHSKASRDLYREFYKPEARAFLQRQRIGKRRPIRSSLPQWYRNLVYATDSVGRGVRLAIKRTPLTRDYRRWKQEAYRCADYGIRIENAGTYNSSQLGELRKLSRRGYNITRLENPNLSALDMRLAVPFLKKTEIELTHENIRDLRKDSFAVAVDDFHLGVIRFREAERRQDPNAQKVMAAVDIDQILSTVDMTKLDPQQYQKMLSLVSLQQKLLKAEEGVGLDWLLIEPNLQVQAAALNYLQKNDISFEAWRNNNLDKCLLPENRKEYFLLQEKAHSRQEYERAHVAHRGYFLDALVHDGSPLVRAEVARQNFGLDELMKDPDPFVRMEVVRQRHRLDEFVRDPDTDVRAEVAMLGHGLAELLCDEEPVVREAAKRSLDLKAKALIRDDGKRPGASLETLMQAASSERKELTFSGIHRDRRVRRERD